MTSSPLVPHPTLTDTPSSAADVWAHLHRCLCHLLGLACTRGSHTPEPRAPQRAQQQMCELPVSSWVPVVDVVGRRMCSSAVRSGMLHSPSPARHHLSRLRPHTLHLLSIGARIPDHSARAKCIVSSTDPLLLYPMPCDEGLLGSKSPSPFNAFFTILSTIP